MGNASSTNTVNNLTNILSQESSSIMQDMSAQAGSENIIQCVGNATSGGGCEISGNKQFIDIKVDMSAVASQMSTQESQQKIVDKIAQSAAATTSGVNFGNSSNTDNVVNDTLNAMLSVSSNLGQQCDFKTGATNIIRADYNSQGKVKIGGNTQQSMTEIMGKCVQNAVANNKALQSVDKDISQLAVSKTEGFDPVMLMLMAALILLLLFIGPGLALGTAAGPIVKMIGALMGLIFIALGSVSIWWWSQNKDSAKRDLIGTQFSTLIKTDPTCAPQKYNPKIPSGFVPVNPLTDAGTICISDPDCKGFDWDTSTKPPTVTYYNSLSINPTTKQCPGVKTQDLKQNGINLTRDPSLLTGTSDPTRETPAKPNLGDVYINTSTGRIWWRDPNNQSLGITGDGKDLDADAIKKNPNFPWQDTGDSVPKWDPKLTIRSGAKPKPDNSIGADGDIFVNIMDPLKWEIWKRYKGTYSPLQGTDAGSLSDVGPNGGTLFVNTYATKQKLAFPGRWADTAPADAYNWSVFVEESSIHKQNSFFLIAGIVLILIGIAIIVIKLMQKNPETKTPLVASSSS